MGLSGLANSVTNESIKKAYRRYAHYYDLVFGAIFHPGRNIAIQHLNIHPGDRILEVGVGTGLSLGIYPENVRVVGIDLSPDMLARAKKKVKSEKLSQVEDLLQMDAENMSFPDNSFDKVVAMYVASVVPNPKRLMEEIQRVCKPGGTLVFINHFQNRNQWVRRAEALLQPLAKYIGFHPDFPLSEFLAKTGFKVERQAPVNILNYWTVLVGKNRKL